MSHLNISSLMCPACGAKLAVIGSPVDMSGGTVGKLAGDTAKDGAPKPISKQDLDKATKEVIEGWGEE